MQTTTTQTQGTASAPWDLPTDGGGRNSWISSRIRVAELIFDATRATSLQLQFDGSRNAIGVQLQQMQGGGTNPTLLLRARTADLYQEPWLVGSMATLWFAKRDGFFAFRCEILSDARGALSLAMPDGVLRHCRRSNPRYRIPGPVQPRLLIALADGTWKETQAILDISVAGLSAQLPADLAETVSVGHIVRLALRLQPDRALEVNGIVRYSRAEGEKGSVCGFELVNVSHTTRLAIERYLQKVRAVPLPDIVTAHLPALPESVRVQLCQATPASVNPTPVSRRTATASRAAF